jgi:hypothetical protein
LGKILKEVNLSWFDDDKNLVILAVFFLGLGILWVDTLTPDQVALIDKMFIGLFGIAVGKASKV